MIVCLHVLDSAFAGEIKPLLFVTKIFFPGGVL
jgi:hypothetical protein